MKPRHATIALSLFAVSVLTSGRASAEEVEVIASAPILLVTDTADPQTHAVDGRADALGRATDRHFDVLFIGQRKMGDDPLTLTRLILAFELPPIPDGQRLASATLAVRYANDRAFDGRTPPVIVRHATEANTIPPARGKALAMYDDEAFLDTGEIIIENGMPLGEKIVDVTEQVAADYASDGSSAASLFRLEAMSEPILRSGDRPPIENRYGIHGFKPIDGVTAPPMLTLEFSPDV